MQNFIYLLMDLRRFPIIKPTRIITHPLTCVNSASATATITARMPSTIAFQSEFAQPWVSSIVSNPSLDSSKYKGLIPICPLITVEASWLTTQARAQRWSLDYGHFRFAALLVCLCRWFKFNRILVGHFCLLLCELCFIFS